MSWFQKLKQGLKKTSDKLSTGITDIFTKKKLDAEALLELEELLITSDLGVEASQKVIKELASKKFDKEIEPNEIKKTLAEIIAKILEAKTGSINFLRSKPHIVLVCGVNGNGKTTAIGKIAAQYTKQGKKVMLGACDTFRAAAGEQLNVWAVRSNSEIITGGPNSDPASVAYKACVEAKERGADILIIDTAGRVANKTPLMEELAKINRVIKKVDPDAPHDTVLVIDATTGQNALKQMESFSQVVDLTGLIVTKLDGSAKAGIIVAIAQKFKVPIIAVGVGESIDDLNSFDPHQFANGLLNT